jgi:hypothetical protein
MPSPRLMWVDKMHASDGSDDVQRRKWVCTSLHHHNLPLSSVVCSENKHIACDSSHYE